MYRLSANGMISGGCLGFAGGALNGDQGSNKSSNQKSSIANQQVTQQGQTNLGISGSTLHQSSVTVIDGDAQVAQGALGVANTAFALSAGLVAQTLSNFDKQQERMNGTVREAVAAAQEVSYRSTAIPESALAEGISKQVLTAVVVLGGIATVAFIAKK